MNSFARYADYVQRHCFSANPDAVPTIGAEIECLALDAATLRVNNLFGAGGTVELLRANVHQLGWIEQNNQHNIPRFHTPSGGVITFEPGGQIEYSSPPFTSASALLRDLELHSAVIERVLSAGGVLIQHTGIDPFNAIDASPLQITAPRYSNMARYFAERGNAGARMMRQTSALQVSVGAGSDPPRRWRLLNRLAPALIALFANSRCYERHDSGYASFRAQTWRETDPARTGVFTGEDPVQEYTHFALNAPDLLHCDRREAFTPYAAQSREHDEAEFAAHLTTLFPEIRPRGWFEIRSIDAQPPTAIAAPIAFIAGIVLDEHAASASLDILPEASEALLCEAGRHGAYAPGLLRILPDLIDIAVSGCARLPAFIDPADVENACELLKSRVPVSV